MAEEVRNPEPQNPAVDPELPQPQPPQRVESPDPVPVGVGPLVIPIIVRPEIEEAEPVPSDANLGITGATAFFGTPRAFAPIAVGGDVDEGTTTFFGDQPTAFEPIGVSQDSGTGITSFFGDESPGRTTLFVDPDEDPGTRTTFFNDAGADAGTTTFFGAPGQVDAGTDPGISGPAEGTTTFFGSPNEEALQQVQTTAALQTAQEQASLQQQYNQTTQRDWRVRIQLAPGSDYLYKVAEGEAGILAPLLPTNGVIFPYVPTINTNYAAKYEQYELTHSNIRGYFYRNSSVGDITVTGAFTAQNTQEAQYLLAVIHFFRSVTKMFYGQDPQRGTPPPLVYLSGFGEYQYNNHSCLVSNFTYNLPNGVDYIRVNPNNLGLNLAGRRQTNSSNPFTISSIINRLQNASAAGLPRGAEPGRVDLGTTAQTQSGTAATTYVPTRMDITVTLLPVQTRSQVSQQFSLKNFANGNLLRGGFW